jgi:hypothetical protein
MQVFAPEGIFEDIVVELLDVLQCGLQLSLYLRRGKDW